MLDSQKTLLKLSELREELTGIEAAENPGRVKEIRAAIAEQEKQYRGQVEAEGKDKEPSAEEKEFAALRNGLSIRNYIRAAAGEARLSDKELEYNQERGIPENQFPLAALALAGDAATTTPANTEAKLGTSIIGRVFASSAARFCGVEMPTVPVGDSLYHVVTAGAMPETKGVGVVKDAEAATISDNTLEPKRITGSYLYYREKAYQVSGYEAALRADLSGALMEAIDKVIIAGSGTAPEPTGLFGSLTDPTDPSKKATWKDFVSVPGKHVDGRYARVPTDIKMLVGSDTIGLMAETVPASGGADRTALEAFRDLGGGIMVSPHVPAAASTIQKALIVKTAAGQHAFAPIWEAGEIIVDRYTYATTGQVRLTIAGFYNFKVVRTDGFSLVEFKVA